MKALLRLLCGLILLVSSGCFGPLTNSVDPGKACYAVVLNTQMLNGSKTDLAYNYGGACMDLYPTCKLVKKTPNVGYCATNATFEERPLAPGEQMCCTATDVVVKTVPAGKALVCSAVDWYLADTLVQGRPEERKHWCCTTSGCKTNTFNAYQQVAYVCTATDAFAFIGGHNSEYACTNNSCYTGFDTSKYEFVCKRFLPPSQ